MSRFTLYFVIFLSLFSFRCLSAQTIFLEAEGFKDKGGWVLDNQFYESVGSGFLLAHGTGIPVKNAQTSFQVDQQGQYYLFVRTRDWMSKWDPNHRYTPGKFNISIDGKLCDSIFGTQSRDWKFQRGGKIYLSKGSHSISLIDLEGYGARCDAIVLTKDPAQKFLASSVELEKFRNRIFSPTNYTKSFDLVVVGGGIAGISAAVQAARQGLQVCLINNRSVWGGMNSVEQKVVVSGDLNVEPFPALGNIVKEIKDIYKRPNDIETLLKREKNLVLMPSFQAIDVRMEHGKIHQVIVRHAESNETFSVTGTYFADCSGDAILGYKAGADYTMKREVRKDYDEDLAPEIPNKLTFGMSLKWKAQVLDTVSTFPAQLPWALQLTPVTRLPYKKKDWFWESGFWQNQIMEAEEIRDYLWRAIYGNWSYLKNSEETREEMKFHKLNDLPYMAGKRESRRLYGDLMFSQKDVEGRWKQYEDAIIPGTYPMDQHFPSLENSFYFPGEEFQGVFKHNHFPVGYDIVYVYTKDNLPVYFIPYRCLYSRNIPNLFMAGRDASISRIAFSSTRVQGTTGMMGEVVGQAAVLCHRYQCSPREIYQKHLQELKTYFQKPLQNQP